MADLKCSRPSARFHIRMVVKINVPAFYLGITERSDGNVLVGFLHDKNYAGLAYAIFGVLAFAIMRTMPERIFAFVLGTSVVWLTNRVPPSRHTW